VSALHAPHERERGFTVMETLLATALLLAIGIGTLGLVGGFARALAARGSASGGSAQIENVLASMRSDAATAFAVFVPAKDIYGAANGGNGVAPHEVDFYTKAQDGSEAWWAYAYAAADSTLRRYDYVPNPSGGAATIGVLGRTGVIDGNAAYPPLTGVTAFSAHTIEASDLTTSDNTFGPLIASLSTAAGVTPNAEPVGFVPKSGAARADLFGGNTTVEVSLQTAQTSRTLHLATTTSPSGFTLHLAPSIRAIIYRKDYSHRFWFGFAQKTWSRIFEQLQYSYTPKVEPWTAWCDYEVYGADSNGLSVGDYHASYRPNEWVESTAGVFYNVTQGNLAGLNPSGCSKTLPTRTQAAPTPAPQTQPGDVVDTPPPCFMQGLCWPQNAPENWSPPSPWPAATAPPQWCVTHNESTLCGGIGGTPQPIPPSAPPPDPATTSYPNPTFSFPPGFHGHPMPGVPAPIAI
jgi:hypothetical protein